MKSWPCWKAKKARRTPKARPQRTPLLPYWPAHSAITLFLIAISACWTRARGRFDQKNSRAGRAEQSCGQFWHKHQVIHRKKPRRQVVPVAVTAAAGAGTHTLNARKLLKYKENSHLSTKNGKPYYDYYVFIEPIKDKSQHQRSARKTAFVTSHTALCFWSVTGVKKPPRRWFLKNSGQQSAWCYGESGARG